MDQLAKGQKALFACLAAILGLVSLFTELPASVALDPELLTGAALVLGPLFVWLVPNRVRDPLTARLANVFDLAREAAHALDRREAERLAASESLEEAERWQVPPAGGFVPALAAILLLAGCAGLPYAARQVLEAPQLLAAEAALVEVCGDSLLQPIMVAELAAAYEAAGIDRAGARAEGIELARCGGPAPAWRFLGPAALPPSSPVPQPRP